jgi:hypothetical protein
MASRFPRSPFLSGLLAGAVLLLAACGDVKNATACESYDVTLVRTNVLKKLQEKFPEYTFEITKVTFSPGEKVPFWHVEALTASSGQKLAIFAMHYCEGSVELTALNPYRP